MRQVTEMIVATPSTTATHCITRKDSCLQLTKT